MRQRVVEAVNLRIDVGRLCTIDDLAGREGAWTDDQTGALHFQSRKDGRRTARRVVPCGHAKGEIEHIHPILLRRHFITAVRAVGVGIDQTGDDRLARDVDGLGPRRNGNLARLADGLDTVIFDQHDTIVDDAAALVRHGHNPRPCKGDHPVGRSAVTGMDSEMPVLGGSNFTGLASLASGAAGKKALVCAA